MMRHPNIVRTTIAAEMSWKEGSTMDIAKVDSLLTRNSHGVVATKVDEMCRPEKLRRLEPCNSKEILFKHEKHCKQTVAFVKEQRERWLKFDKGDLSILEALQLLSDNESFKVAEQLRSAGAPDWLQLVGLIRDLGKMMALPQLAGKDVLDEWAVVGNSFPVGCALPVPETKNPDHSHPLYGTEHGIYQPGCGISNLMMPWGKDEYIYQMLKFNQCTLPVEALKTLRLQSFSLWHQGAYRHFEANGDAEIRRWVKQLNATFTTTHKD